MPADRDIVTRLADLVARPDSIWFVYDGESNKGVRRTRARALRARTRFVTWRRPWYLALDADTPDHEEILRRVVEGLERDGYRPVVLASGGTMTDGSPKQHAWALVTDPARMAAAVAEAGPVARTSIRPPFSPHRERARTVTGFFGETPEQVYEALRPVEPIAELSARFDSWTAEHPAGGTSARLHVVADTGEQADLPDSYFEAAVAGMRRAIVSTGEGARHDTLLAAAVRVGSMIGAGYGRQLAGVDDILIAAGQAAGFSRSEAKRTVRDGIRWGEENGSFEPGERASVDRQVSDIAELRRVWALLETVELRTQRDRTGFRLAAAAVIAGVAAGSRELSKSLRQLAELAQIGRTTISAHIHDDKSFLAQALVQTEVGDRWRPEDTSSSWLIRTAAEIAERVTTGHHTGPMPAGRAIRSVGCPLVTRMPAPCRPPTRTPC